ncbi:MAG: alpha-isopropylmalate synthase regulatory domain-containing protein [bacterium]|nr:alpha-isopropylmalate synthase regulatory domain-containing protein [bacterium]
MKKPKQPDRIIVNGISVISSTGGISRCQVTIEVDIGGEEQTLTFESNQRDVGPVSGICGAFRKIVPDFTWADFAVNAVMPGENSDARATVTIKNNGDTFAGQGVHNNTLQAAAMAIADGLYKLSRHAFNEAMRRYDVAAATTGG